MTAFLVVAGAALAAALLCLALRGARSSGKRRGTAVPADGVQRASRIDREWIRVLAHELRSPIGAVLGYSELLAEGAFGPLEPAAADAVRRLRAASDQMIVLIDGLDPPDRGSRPAAARLPSESLLHDARAALAHDADSRAGRIVVDDGATTFVTDPARARLALYLTLGAAIKASPGAEIRLSTAAGAAPSVIVDGSRLDPEADDPDRSTAVLTGAGLRIALARQALAAVGGAVTLEPVAGGVRLRLSLPALQIDAAEETP
jgi:signal transduction histidine kinase